MTCDHSAAVPENVEAAIERYATAHEMHDTDAETLLECTAARLALDSAIGAAIAAAIQAERERCASLAEQWAAERNKLRAMHEENSRSEDRLFAQAYVLQEFAEAIRGRDT